MIDNILFYGYIGIVSLNAILINVTKDNTQEAKDAEPFAQMFNLIPFSWFGIWLAVYAKLTQKTEGEKR